MKNWNPQHHQHSMMKQPRNISQTPVPSSSSSSTNHQPRTQLGHEEEAQSQQQHTHLSGNVDDDSRLTSFLDNYNNNWFSRPSEDNSVNIINNIGGVAEGRMESEPDSLFIRTPIEHLLGITLNNDNRDLLTSQLQPQARPRPLVQPPLLRPQIQPEARPWPRVQPPLLRPQIRPEARPRPWVQPPLLTPEAQPRPQVQPPSLTLQVQPQVPVRTPTEIGRGRGRGWGRELRGGQQGQMRPQQFNRARTPSNNNQVHGEDLEVNMKSLSEDTKTRKDEESKASSTRKLSSVEHANKPEEDYKDSKASRSSKKSLIEDHDDQHSKAATKSLSKYRKPESKATKQIKGKKGSDGLNCDLVNNPFYLLSEHQHSEASSGISLSEADDSPEENRDPKASTSSKSKSRSNNRTRKEDSPPRSGMPPSSLPPVVQPEVPVQSPTGTGRGRVREQQPEVPVQSPTGTGRGSVREQRRGRGRLYEWTWTAANGRLCMHMLNFFPQFPKKYYKEFGL